MPGVALSQSPCRCGPRLFLPEVMCERDRSPMIQTPSAGSGDEIEALMQAGLALTTEPSLHGALQKITDVARDVLRARCAVLGVVDERAAGLSQPLTAGVDEAGKAPVDPLGAQQEVLTRLIRERQPIRIRRLAAHPPSAGCPSGRPATESFLGVPIVVREKVHGSLHVTGK